MIGRLRWLAFAAVVAVAAWLRFGDLDQPSYWLDEILYEQLTRAAASQPWWKWLIGSEAEHAGLYYLSQLLMPGRVAAAIFGLAALAVAWQVAGIIDRRAQVPVVLLLAVSPLHVYYSREARSYALLMLLTAALIWVLLRGSSLIACAGLLAAMLFTTAVAAPVVVAAGLVACACAVMTRDRWYWRAAAASLVTLILFRLLYSSRPYAGAGWPDFPQLDAQVFDGLLRTFTVSALGERIAARAAVAMLVLAVAGAIAVTRRDRRHGVILIGMTALPFAGALASLWLFKHFFATRYLTPALIGFVLLAACGAAAMVRYEILAVVLAGLIAAQTWPAARHEPYQKLDWRQIAQTIWTQAKPGDLVVAAEPWSEVSLRYYLAQLPPKVKLVHIFAADVADMQRQLHRGTWLVTAGFTPNPQTRNWMCNFPLVLASPLESFRLHFASPEISSDRPVVHAEGWGDQEGSFRWAIARKATIVIPRWSAHDEVIRMRLLPAAAGQTMRVALNGQPIGEVELAHEWSEHSFSAPARLWIDGVNRLSFEFAFVRIPGNGDGRTLAVAFEGLDAGPELARLSSLIDARTAWRNTDSNFPPEQLNRDSVVALISRLGFHPESIWPRLASAEIRLENLGETVAWGAECDDDDEFLRKAFAALLSRAPAPHEKRELLALPRARIPGQMMKWPEFRDAMLKR